MGRMPADPYGAYPLYACDIVDPHRAGAEGFRSMDLFPTVITEVPKGQAFEFQLTLVNPWLHELQNVNGYVNISGAPGLSFPGERDPAPFAFDGSINANPGSASCTRGWAGFSSVMTSS